MRLFHHNYPDQVLAQVRITRLDLPPAMSVSASAARQRQICESDQLKVFCTLRYARLYVRGSCLLCVPNRQHFSWKLAVTTIRSALQGAAATFEVSATLSLLQCACCGKYGPKRTRMFKEKSTRLNKTVKLTVGTFCGLYTAG